MKKLKFSITILLILFAVVSVSAQNESESLLPKKGSFGTSLILDGLIDNIKLSSNENNYGQNILFGKYYLEDDLALRLGIGFSLNSSTREASDSSGAGLLFVELDSSRRVMSMNVSAGIEKHFVGTNRIDPYIFGQLDVSLIGKDRTELEARATSTIGTGTATQETIIDGGYAIGINAGMGLNFFLAKQLSVGSEVFLGFQHVALGGGISDNLTVVAADGTRSSTFSESSERTKTSDLNVSPTAQINISYFF